MCIRDRDWETVKTEAVNRASERVRSLLPNKQILPRVGVGTQSETLRDYEDNIIRATASLACSQLVYSVNAELATALELRIDDPDTDNGLLNRIKSSEIALWHEVTENVQEGILTVVSLNASTTGSIIDTKGKATTSFDIIKIIITAGGTFETGVASAVTYSIYIGDQTGLQTVVTMANTVIDGNYQYAAHGVYIRFSAGVYATNDTWNLELRGDPVEAGTTLYTITNRRV
jgi:hypothetical protein